jgi:hypothetical protein
MALAASILLPEIGKGDVISNRPITKSFTQIPTSIAEVTYGEVTVIKVCSKFSHPNKFNLPEISLVGLVSENELHCKFSDIF